MIRSCLLFFHANGFIRDQWFAPKSDAKDVTDGQIEKHHAHTQSEEVGQGADDQGHNGASDDAGAENA